jgi:hypothetical protein
MEHIMAKPSLTPEELDQLRWAHQHLEHPSFAARLSNVIGTPIEQTLKLLPKSWHQRVNRAAEFSIRQAMTVAIKSLDVRAASGARDTYHKLAAFTAGAVGGFFGPITLAAELPVITVLMLRSIADIARSEGEDLDTLDARLACVEVFALGGRSNDDDATDTGYYGLRSTLAFHFAGVADYSGGSGLNVPAGVELIRGIAARFGVVISDEVAVRMVPVAGAISGGLLNLVFMQHFQDVARGHFTLRRLERKYKLDIVRKEYERIQKENIKLIKGFSPLEGW